MGATDWYYDMMANVNARIEGEQSAKDAGEDLMLKESVALTELVSSWIAACDSMRPLTTLQVNEHIVDDDALRQLMYDLIEMKYKAMGEL